MYVCIEKCDDSILAKDGYEQTNMSRNLSAI